MQNYGSYKTITMEILNVFQLQQCAILVTATLHDVHMWNFSNANYDFIIFVFITLSYVPHFQKYVLWHQAYSVANLSTYQ
jgi:hypothetical protein